MESVCIIYGYWEDLRLPERKLKAMHVDVMLTIWVGRTGMHESAALTTLLTDIIFRCCLAIWMHPPDLGWIRVLEYLQKPLLKA